MTVAAPGGTTIRREPTESVAGRRTDAGCHSDRADMRREPTESVAGRRTDGLQP